MSASKLSQRSINQIQVVRQFSTSTRFAQLKTQVLSKQQKKQFADLMELTKFKLSLLNTAGSFTMFYYHAPLIGMGLFDASLFIFATQTVAMATQCFG
jgi:hypothetical protein